MGTYFNVPQDDLPYKSARWWCWSNEPEAANWRAVADLESTRTVIELSEAQQGDYFSQPATYIDYPPVKTGKYFKQLNDLDATHPGRADEKYFDPKGRPGGALVGAHLLMAPISSRLQRWALLC